jgi:gamma-glutamyltranspeptidase/glutathione hydrolase
MRGMHSGASRAGRQATRVRTARRKARLPVIAAVGVLVTGLMAGFLVVAVLRAPARAASVTPLPTGPLVPLPTAPVTPLPTGPTMTPLPTAPPTTPLPTAPPTTPQPTSTPTAQPTPTVTPRPTA